MDSVTKVINKEKNYAVFPLVCADHCAWLCKTPFKEVVQDGEKLAGVIYQAYQEYAYDMVLIFSDPYVEAQALGCAVEFSPRLKLLGPSSRIVETIAPIKSVRAGRAHASCGIDRTHVILRAAEILKKKAPVPVYVSVKGPFSLAAFIATTDHFLKLLIVAEEKARRFIDVALDFQHKYIARLIELGVGIFIGDPMASSSIISPELFRKFAFEPLRMLVKEIKNGRCYAGIHVCGNSLPIMSMLDDVGADILSVEDISPETRTLKMGGVSTSTIYEGDREKIKHEISRAAGNTRLIISTSCDVPAETDPVNVKAMIQFAREIT
ncbi:MAG TPA: uroporphyrinogen decarboxylase family protein [bacterium]